MDNDPYDTSLNWMPQQRQLPPTYPEGRLRTNYAPRPAVQTRPARMSKVEALARVDSLKKYIVVGSLLSFGALSALVANQLNASANPTPSNQPVQSPAGPTVQDPSSPAMPSDPSSGGFFNQQGDQQGGGYGFGSGGSSSAPFTRSRTS